MKYKFYFLFLLVLSIQVSAQVTIGSNLDTNLGSLLDLKETDNGSGKANSTRGLLLPRVNLQSLTNLKPEGASFSGDDLHVGLMIYNLKSNPKEGLCPGVYTWSGDTWEYLFDRECICEYTIIGQDSKEYHIYCEDFTGDQASAGNVCQTNAINVGKTYHLMTYQEYTQIWNKPTLKTGVYSFTDGNYFMNYGGWITLGNINSGANTVVGVGFPFSGGQSIGGMISGTQTVRCLRN
ncbi:MAG: hypothetical protein LBV43_02900 [Prevotella sp.]|jgi:hypothetical protein|nr:hypothetical protein [Prevotella sp.]